MKNRSELREVAMTVLYQVYIFQDSNQEYETEYVSVGDKISISKRRS